MDAILISQLARLIFHQIFNYYEILFAVRIVPHELSDA